MSSFVGLGGGCRRCICSSGHRCSRFSHRNIAGQLCARSQVQGVALGVDGLPVGACRDLHRLGIIQKLICKALLHSLFAGHVGGVSHHVQQHSLRKAGFPLVDGNLTLIPCVVGIRRFAQLVGIVIAPDKRPALVNHDEAGRICFDGITGTHDKAAARHGHAVHNTGQLCALGSQLTQPVMNQDRHAGITAYTVHADGNLRAMLDLLQVGQELALDDVLARNRFARPPIRGLRVHNLAVHGDVSSLAVSAGHCIAGPLDAHHRGATRCFRHFLYLPV